MSARACTVARPQAEETSCWVQLGASYCPVCAWASLLVTENDGHTSPGGVETKGADAGGPGRGDLEAFLSGAVQVTAWWTQGVGLAWVESRREEPVPFVLGMCVSVCVTLAHACSARVWLGVGDPITPVETGS